VQTNHFKTNLPIERFVLEKKGLRRAWHTNRSSSSKQRLKEATRTLSRALKPEAVNAQLRHIEQLSTASTKHPLWRAHTNLSYPIKTVTPIKNSSGSWFRSDEDRAETFASHLRSVFQLNPATGSFVLPQIESETVSLAALFPPMEIAKVIGELKPKRGVDLISPK